MVYRCDAVSVEAFVQQLAVSYVGQGYWFYVTGRIPAAKDPLRVDRKLITRYGIGISKWSRARRKRGGLANLHYLRYDRFFILLATKGEHDFFVDEPHFRDVRRTPIRFRGYSIGYRRGADGSFHPSVRINLETYRTLKAYLLEVATRRSCEALARTFQKLRFEPYAPVRRQLLNLLRAVNRARRTAGLETLSTSVLRLRRRPLKVFQPQELDAAA